MLRKGVREMSQKITIANKGGRGEAKLQNVRDMMDISE